MKKYLIIITILCLMSGMLLVGCANNNVENQGQKQQGSTGGVDVDLTALSSTMVYAEVNNMMTNPTEYIGKTIKMNGPYYALADDETGSYYHFVVIEDATACCQSGMEFIWKGKHSYPDDYPKDKTKVEVVGVFKSGEEDGQPYYYLSVDDVLILKKS